jgi:arylsulfatase A-like enzyme
MASTLMFSTTRLKKSSQAARITVGTALALTWFSCSTEPLPRPSGLRPNVMMVVVDTLRRDHLGAYGYRREVSPHIDAFAESAVVFDRAYAQSPSTKPSIASLFTSTLPTDHGTIFNEHALPQHYVTVAEVFQAAGYETAGFGENPIVRSDFDFDQGFDEYETQSNRHSSRNDGPNDEFDRSVHDWLGDHAHEEFFLMVHFVDPHSPYWAPEPFRGRFSTTDGPAGQGLNVLSSNLSDVDEAIAKYDEEILYIDQRFGGLLDRLEALEIGDDTIVVVLSDHGEAFGEHGQFHHSHSVYSELINIPLLISQNAQMKPGRRPEPVQHMDLFPTLIDLTGISMAALSLGEVQTLQGASLVDSKRDELDQRGVISEHLRVGWGKRMRSVVSGQLKFIEYLDSDRVEVFNAALDPSDTVDRRDATPLEVRHQLHALLPPLNGVDPEMANPGIDIDPGLKEELRMLGYLPQDHDHAF